MSDVLNFLREYPELLQAGGILGSVIYVGGFALIQCGYACGNGTGYSLSKIVAAILVLLSLVDAFNMGAFLIQIGFIMFGLVGMVNRRMAQPQKEPRRFIIRVQGHGAKRRGVSPSRKVSLVEYV